MNKTKTSNANREKHRKTNTGTTFKKVEKEEVFITTRQTVHYTKIPSDMVTMKKEFIIILKMK